MMDCKYDRDNPIAPLSAVVEKGLGILLSLYRAHHAFPLTL